MEASNNARDVVDVNDGTIRILKNESLLVVLKRLGGQDFVGTASLHRRCAFVQASVRSGPELASSFSFVADG
jgi:hypothetical protein